MIFVTAGFDLVSIDIGSIFREDKFYFKFILDTEANLDLIAKLEIKI